MSCPVCGCGVSRPKLRTGGVDVEQCGACGLQFWRPAAGFDPRETYDGVYFEGSRASRGYDDYGSLEASLRRNFARRLERLPPPSPDARLLDVGAAYGFAVDEATRLGWRAVGVEVSAAAARAAAVVSGGRVALADATALPFPPRSFDAVTLWDVLEHLPDPHAAVGALADLLRPSGHFVLTTGDAGSLLARLSGSRWHLYTIPEHFFFYTRRSLSTLLEAHGLRIESMRAEAAVYTAGYLVERLRKTLLGHTAGCAARWPGAGITIPVNLFDVLTVSAVRD